MGLGFFLVIFFFTIDKDDDLTILIIFKNVYLHGANCGTNKKKVHDDINNFASH
jgi:hypothetical protein